MKFYAQERARWPDLNDAFISETWARKALLKLTRHFRLDQMPYGTGPIPLRFAGRSTSWGGASGITLAPARDWLVFLHEVAHVWEYRKHGRTDHRPRLARYVDLLCTYAVAQRWAQQDANGQFEAWDETARFVEGLA